MKRNKKGWDRTVRDFALRPAWGHPFPMIPCLRARLFGAPFDIKKAAEHAAA